MTGAKSNKNRLENLAGVAKDGQGRSGADLQRDALVNVGKTTVGAGKDGARLEQIAADATITIT